MNPTEVSDRLAVGGTAGLIAGLVFAIFAIVLGFQTRWIVPGWLYKKTEDSCESWQKLAESQGDKIERLTTLVETQKITTDRTSERADRTATIAESNASKLDRVIVILESTRRPSR